MPDSLLTAKTRDLDVLFPGIRAAAYRDDQIAGSGGFRLPHHAHPRFAWELIPFAMVASIAGAGRVGPIVFAPTRARQDVIHGQVALGDKPISRDFTGANTAVNTLVAVACQDALAAPMGFAARYVDKRAQGNNRRHRKFISHGAQEVTSLFDDNGFFGKNQVDGAGHGNNCQRFPTAAI